MPGVDEDLEPDYEEASLASTGSATSYLPPLQENDSRLFVNQAGADPDYFARSHVGPIEENSEEDESEDDMEGPIPTHEQLLTNLTARIERGETLGVRKWTTVQEGRGWRRNIAEQGTEARTYQDPGPLESHLAALYAAREGVQQHDHAYPGEYGDQLDEVRTHPEQAHLTVPPGYHDDSSESSFDPREPQGDEPETFSDPEEPIYDDEPEFSSSSDDEVDAEVPHGYDNHYI